MTSSAREGRDYVIPDFFTNPVLRPYLRNVLNWQGYIRFLGLPDRRDNPDIVIDRLFVAPSLTRRYISPDENPDNWRDEAETLLDAVSDNTPLVLLGDPGIGKSTLMNQITWLLSRPATNPLIERLGWRLPLPMVLRELPVHGVTDFDGLLEAFLSREMSAPLRDDGGRRYLNQTLAEGNAFLLLDGIDEIGDRSSRNSLREAVFDGISRFPDCRWLLSSRIVGYDEVPFDMQTVRLEQDLSSVINDDHEQREELLREYRREQHSSRRGYEGGRVAIRYIAPFDDARIVAFAHNWYTQREAATQRARANANHLVRAVHADDSILRLARVPNLLTMMALIHRIEATLPHGRALLYERIAEAYLESIDRYRGIDPSPHDLPRKKGWLARVGFELQRRRTSRDHRESSDILVDFDTVMGWLNEEMNRGDRFRDSPSAREFLKIVGRRSGLFLPRGEGRYAFVHLSFQEYFAAVALAREVTRLRWARGRESRLGFDLDTLANWAGESIWRETFAFLFELLASEEEDDWHADLLVCVFGEDFSRLDNSKSTEVSLNLGHLLARLVVNSRSGLSLTKRDQAIACCVKAQFQIQFRNRRDKEPARIFADLVRDDTQLNAKVLKEIAAQLEMEMPGNRQLDLRGSLVSDLGPLANLNTLEQLYLDSVQISDIGPLSYLTALERIDLYSTQISDISPLANLTSLEWLNLMRTQVSDISSLANLTCLEWLNLMSTQVSDIGPLANLDSLEYLLLSGTQISDFSPLTSLTALRWLMLMDTQISDVRPIANLTTLERLDLDRTQVCDIKLLAKLSALKSLDLRCTPIVDVGPLASLAALEHLVLQDTKVSDMGPLASLTALERLDLNRTKVTDIKPLANLPALRSLDLTGTAIPDIGPLTNLVALEHLILTGTQISTSAIDALCNSRPDLEIEF